MEARARAIHLLKTVGLSEYEAKAYLALLSHGEPMNGYEVAKDSGVPRSTVYEALSKLVRRGAAVPVHGSGRTNESFVAQPVDVFIERYRSRLEGTLDGLGESLPRLAAERRSHIVQHLVGRDEIMLRMGDVIQQSEQYLWLSLWPDVALELRTSARRKAATGVQIASVMFGAVESFPGRVIPHTFLSPSDNEERLGCRLFVVVADHQEVVIAAADGDGWWGMWSDDLSVALLAAEYVRYDITVQTLGRHLDVLGVDKELRNDTNLVYLRDSTQPNLRDLLGERPDEVPLPEKRGGG